MVVGACGTAEHNLCCPVAVQSEGAGCNLLGRKKQDPHFYYNKPATEGGGLALTEATFMKDHKVNGLNPVTATREPQGALFGTSGIDKFNKDGGSVKGEGPTSCNVNPWATGNYKAKQCYSSTGLTSVPAMIDEYRTECGFGDKDKWYSGNGEEAIVLPGADDKLSYWAAYLSGGGGKLVVWPPAAGCATVAPATPTGFIRTDASQCNIKSEWQARRDLTSDLRSTQTNINWADHDGGDPAAFRIGPTTANDRACHFKYKKDWDRKEFGSPPRFKMAATALRDTWIDINDTAWNTDHSNDKYATIDLNDKDVAMDEGQGDFTEVVPWLISTLPGAGTETKIGEGCSVGPGIPEGEDPYNDKQKNYIAAFQKHVAAECLLIPAQAPSTGTGTDAAGAAGTGAGAGAGPGTDAGAGTGAAGTGTAGPGTGTPGSCEKLSGVGICEYHPPITPYPVSRMDCCLETDPDSLRQCVFTSKAIDYYSNEEIETYGAGLYGAKTNTCARYITERDGPDTPDEWCSRDIMKDGSQEGNWILNEETYDEYMKLLTDTKCTDWLALDFKESITPQWKDKHYGDRGQDQKPRSKALGYKFRDFFLWVAKNLADPQETPPQIPNVGKNNQANPDELNIKTSAPEIIRSDLRQFLAADDDDDCNAEGEYPAKTYIGTLVEKEDEDPTADPYPFMAMSIWTPDIPARLTCESNAPAPAPLGTGSTEELNTSIYKSGSDHGYDQEELTDLYISTTSSVPTIKGGTLEQRTHGYKRDQYDRAVTGLRGDAEDYAKAVTDDFNKSMSQQIYETMYTEASVQPKCSDKFYEYGSAKKNSNRLDSTDPLGIGSTDGDSNFYPCVPVEADGIETYRKRYGEQAAIDLEAGTIQEVSLDRYEMDDTKSDSQMAYCGYSHSDEITGQSERSQSPITDAYSRCKMNNKGQCCNPRGLPKIDYEYNKENLRKYYEIETHLTSLREKKFNIKGEGARLGMFLNFMTTPAAGAFVNYGLLEMTDNPKNAIEDGRKLQNFMSDMKTFAARKDIFNWKDETARDHTQKETNKYYNALLSERYNQICACFWEGENKDSDRDTNPVSYVYDIFTRFSQCHGLGVTPEATGDCANGNVGKCKLSNSDYEACRNPADNLEQTVLDFTSTNNVANRPALRIDNACWFPGCKDKTLLNPDYDHARYGLSTRNTHAVITTPECNTSFCSSSCFLKNTINVGGDISGASITQTATCDKKTACDIESGKPKSVQYYSNYDSTINSSLNVGEGGGKDEGDGGVKSYFWIPSVEFRWWFMLIACVITFWYAYKNQ
jgi:hypothetical protein